MAIQYVSFDPVSEAIIKSPQILSSNSSMKSETTNPLKDGPCGLSGDGTVSSHQAQVKGKDGKHVRFQGVKDMDPVKWFYLLDSFFLERCTWSWFISDFVAMAQCCSQQKI